MPTITIYLTNDLYDLVRGAPSKIVREALEFYFKRREGSQESSAPQGQSANGSVTDEDTVPNG